MNGIIFRNINISVIIHFYLAKHIFSLDPFWTHAQILLSSSEAQGCVELLFITITSRSTLTQSSGLYLWVK